MDIQMWCFQEFQGNCIFPCISPVWSIWNKCVLGTLSRCLLNRRFFDPQVGTPKWMVYFMENPMNKWDDLGGFYHPYFWEQYTLGGGNSNIFFNFYHYLGKWSNLTCAYFSDGLVQPPTRKITTRGGSKNVHPSSSVWLEDKHPGFQENLHPLEGSRRIACNGPWKITMEKSKPKMMIMMIIARGDSFFLFHRIHV